MGPHWRFGAFWLTYTYLFNQMGGFDSAFGLFYWEDTDLWARMESAGHQLAGWRGTWVKHKGGASSHPLRDEVFLKNKALFEARHGEKK